MLGVGDLCPLKFAKDSGAGLESSKVVREAAVEVQDGKAEKIDREKASLLYQ